MITPLAKIKLEIKNNKFDAILISSVPNIIYLTNFPGFTTDEREAFLLICKDKQYFLTDARSSGTVKNQIKDFDLVEISVSYPLEKALKDLARKHRIKRIAFEGNDISFLEHKKLLQCFDDSNHRSFESLRSVKTIEEINKIEKACKMGDETFGYILKKIKPGVSEKELANEIELFIKRQGANISFATIVAFGKNSAIPHHVPSNRKLKTDNIVLLDFGVKLNGYCSDMTRTIFFSKAPAEFKKIYNAVLESQSLAIQQFNNLTMKQSRINASEIDKIARDYIISKGYKTIPHSLGHGIGIQIHESPRLSPKSKDILKEGMVFSIEPGIYIENLGGVRIEDLVVLEKRGVRLLTHSPKHLIEL